MNGSKGSVWVGGRIWDIYNNEILYLKEYIVGGMYGGINKWTGNWTLSCTCGSARGGYNCTSADCFLAGMTSDVVGCTCR